ncbi:unnamed protein product [Soboliphyme baturini]|uniref:Uncharacterized protein n=1 Tax=Soboliphyme baturini TaxID=241478 RepID=A0A183IE29_9BILA|nr:unnamed protein product [Soboliphyme baturini]
MARLRLLPVVRRSSSNTRSATEPFQPQFRSPIPCFKELRGEIWPTRSVLEKNLVVSTVHTVSMSDAVLTTPMQYEPLHEIQNAPRHIICLVYEANYTDGVKTRLCLETRSTGLSVLCPRPTDWCDNI